ncbi:MAG TPA: efflux RND transporter periplasmic adaptor subunit [Acidobacteriaceae bacterium]|nr:efflux RND transporter periplasmic adaptor subunit [Terriglobia bacterium]HVC91687.1 efflux RND transporter periplasmic adaptor subunit [Acidobacteriaceae bacterium]
MAVVQLAPADTSITVPGVFQAYQDVLVHAEVSGYIKNIFVDIGDRVHTGEVLAILEVPELDADVNAAQAAVRRDKSEIQRTRNDVARAVAVHTALHAEYARLKTAAATLPGLIAQQDLDNKQAQDLSSEAQIDAAKSAYAAAQEKVSEDVATLQRYKAMQAYSYVRAPFNGVVTFRFADTGALIAAGTDESKNAMPIVRLAQSDLLRLRMPVPESDANYMRIGGPAVVQVQSTGETIHTKIVRFTRSLDTDTRTMLTEVDIPNQDLHLSPGMYANTTFPLRRDRDAMVVPIDAIAEGDQPYVLIVDNTNHVVKSPVVLGIQGPNFYQVVKGVHIGDRVIVGSLSDYQPGQKVAPSAVDMSLTTFKQTSSHLQSPQPNQQSVPSAKGQK